MDGVEIQVEGIVRLTQTNSYRNSKSMVIVNLKVCW